MIAQMLCIVGKGGNWFEDIVFMNF